MELLYISMMLPLPRLYLGTMTFGWESSSSFISNDIALRFVNQFSALGHAHVDTASIYSGGQCEGIVGDVLSCLKGKNNLKIGTKAHPSLPGGLSKVGMRAQWTKSWNEIGVSRLEEYYLHQPDTENDILPSLEFVSELIDKGKVKRLGLSNYNVLEVERIFNLCESHNLHKPTVYQGIYNPLNRVVEDDLLPCLRSNGCDFIAYNPLAAGLLTGKHRRGGEVISGRFKNNENYMPRFYTDDNFSALEALEAACSAHQVELVDATFRWMMLHSALTESDGLLIGASSIAQLESNLDSLTDPAPLPEHVREVMDDVYNRWTKRGAFPYFRGYSKCMPNKEQLESGATYQR